MKITKRQLRRIIKEEKARLNEARFPKELGTQIVDAMPRLMGDQPEVRWSIGADTRYGRLYIYANEDLDVIGYGAGKDTIRMSPHPNHNADGSVIEMVGPRRFKVTKLRAAPAPAVMKEAFGGFSYARKLNLIRTARKALQSAQELESTSAMGEDPDLDELVNMVIGYEDAVKAMLDFE
jgi:hypothetical protein